MEINFQEIIPSFEYESSGCQEATSDFGIATEFPINRKNPQPCISKIIFTNYPQEYTEDIYLLMKDYSWANRHLFFDALSNKVSKIIIISNNPNDIQRLKEIISEIKNKTGKNYRYNFLIK